MTSSHMKKIVWGCILLLTSVVFFSSGLWAQQQTQTASRETGFYYTVQEGDTLWDISRKFFTSPWLWPDLWAQNQEVSNPHWIYPGEILHIYMSGGKVYVEKVAKVPPPAEPQAVAPALSYYVYSSIQQVGFIRKPAVSPDGVIFKIQGGKVIAGTGDILYLRQEAGGSLPVGSRFTLYRTFPPVEDPQDKKATIGTQHYLTGVAEITRQEDGYSLAEVVKSYREIEINDRAMPYEEMSAKIFLPENTPEITGTVLLAEEQTNLMGEHTVAFIDKGERDGVVPGQQFHVYHQDGIRLDPEDEEATLLPPEDAGIILVLRAEQNTATVVVLASRTEMAPGTKFATTLD